MVLPRLYVKPSVPRVEDEREQERRPQLTTTNRVAGDKRRVGVAIRVVGAAGGEASAGTGGAGGADATTGADAEGCAGAWPIA